LARDSAKSGSVQTARSSPPFQSPHTEGVLAAALERFIEVIGEAATKISAETKNCDGSVDIYFGPKPPESKESSWIPTDPDRRFFLLFRFYGPEPAVFDGSFELNDVELLS
jgi:hypothetical protein